MDKKFHSGQKELYAAYLYWQNHDNKFLDLFCLWIVHFSKLLWLCNENCGVLLLWLQEDNNLHFQI